MALTEQSGCVAIDARSAITCPVSLLAWKNRRKQGVAISLHIQPMQEKE